MSYGEPRGMLLMRPFYTLKLYRNTPDRAFFDHAFPGKAQAVALLHLVLVG